VPEGKADTLLHGLMMDSGLLVKRLLWRAERVFGAKEVVTRTSGRYETTNWDHVARRARQLAGALGDLGVRPGDRVGTLAWNSGQHLECYFGITCMGSVLHTGNLRLHPQEIAYTIDHAGDVVLLVDRDQLPIIEEIREQIPKVRTVVVLGDREPPASSLPGVLGYEDLLAAHDGDLEFPDLDERQASGICYTSGTTGRPKGVLYSHRSMVLQTLALSLHDSFGVRERQRLLLAVPMFHVNGWCLPFATAMQGATLLLPGTHPLAADYLEMIRDLRATDLVGAVAIGAMVRDEFDRNPDRYDLSSLETAWFGGQAPPRSLMEWWLERHGIDTPQGWGMTESSPLVTYTSLRSEFDEAEPGERYDIMAKQGLPLPLVELRAVTSEGTTAPWDGMTPGELQLRGPWVAGAYYDDDRSPASFDDGWLRTGDVGTVDQLGYVHVVDRAKDLIKSGGEWISSVELENRLMSHPKVREACVVGVPDDRWQERPLAFVVPRSTDDPPDEGELVALLKEHVPSWWIPDRFELVEVPKTSVGKFDKKLLRAQLLQNDEGVNGAKDGSGG
jgi:fatty-acyl-CoA synthase